MGVARQVLDVIVRTGGTKERAIEQREACNVSSVGEGVWKIICHPQILLDRIENGK